MSAAHVASIDSGVGALCLSGWRGVHVVGGGRSIRDNVVRALALDVMLALTYKPNECSSNASCAEEVLQQWNALRSHVVRVSLSPMLSTMELQRRMQSMPHWPDVLTAFSTKGAVCHGSHAPTASEPHRCASTIGNNFFAPVLGSAHLHVLRQLHDLSRCLNLIEEAEAEGSFRYETVLHSRPEYVWARPHPPLTLLAPASHAWIPWGNDWYGGLNDRHAVLSRRNADAYFRRWERILDGTIMQIVPQLLYKKVDNGLKLNSEWLLRNTLNFFNVSIRRFPTTAALACCTKSVDHSSGCGISAADSHRGGASEAGCNRKLILAPAVARAQCEHERSAEVEAHRAEFIDAIGRLLDASGGSGSGSGSGGGGGGGAHASSSLDDADGHRHVAWHGKYGDELHMAWLHSLALDLPGVKLAHSHIPGFLRGVEGRWGLAIHASRQLQPCFRAMYDGLELHALNLTSASIPRWWAQPSQARHMEVRALILWV